MGMGFAPTWLRQVSPPPASHDHFNHCTNCHDSVSDWSPSQTDIAKFCCILSFEGASRRSVYHTHLNMFIKDNLQWKDFSQLQLNVILDVLMCLLIILGIAYGRQSQMYFFVIFIPSVLLTLFIGWQDGLLKSHTRNPQMFFFGGPSLTRSNPLKNRPVKQNRKVVAVAAAAAVEAS